MGGVPILENAKVVKNEAGGGDRGWRQEVETGGGDRVDLSGPKSARLVDHFRYDVKFSFFFSIGVEITTAISFLPSAAFCLPLPPPAAAAAAAAPFL